MDVIAEARSNFKLDYVEQKKGARYFDDNRVTRRLRMRLFEYRSDGKRPHEVQLPTVDQLSEADPEWLKQNIDIVLRDLSELDWHYNNKEKWT